MKTHTLIIVLLLLFTTATFAQSNSSPSNTQTSLNKEDATDSLKILSWNIYMLPRFIMQTGKLRRARAIGQELRDSDYDVIIFQEAFHAGTRQILKGYLKKNFPYRVGPANKKMGFGVNSGVWIFSKHPIKEHHVVEFDDCYGIVDCWARKGALLATIDYNGKEVQVLGTHMQASGASDVRVKQYNQIAKDLIEPHSKEGVPLFACGDYNISNKNTSVYEDMLKTLNVEDGDLLSEDKATSNSKLNDMSGYHRYGGREEVIDYIFYKANKIKTSFFYRGVPKIKRRWNKKHEDLSDHNPVEAIILFEE